MSRCRDGTGWVGSNDKGGGNDIDDSNGRGVATGKCCSSSVGMSNGSLGCHRRGNSNMGLGNDSSLAREAFWLVIEK